MIYAALNAYHADDEERERTRERIPYPRPKPDEAAPQTLKEEMAQWKKDGKAAYDAWQAECFRLNYRAETTERAVLVRLFLPFLHPVL